MIRTLLVSLGFLSLLGCVNSSPPQKTNFYLLSHNQSKIKMQGDDKSAKYKTLTLVSVKVPEYLQQPSLVIQTRAHKLHFAQFERWAESLQPAIARIIASEISAQGVTAYLQDEYRDADKKLFIRIDHFYPTFESKVLLVGRFWVKEKDKNKIVLLEDFRLEAELSEDGYQHSVKRMRELLAQLGSHISAKIF